MIYDTIVVGGGHAGIEAALAVARMQKKSMLITGDFSKVASLPCNPSLGGPAKGVVVREIDALGGEMGKSADKGQIQMKMLNTSKGPAVYALRAQLDKKKYPEIMLDVLKTTKNLTLLEDFVEKLIIEDNQVKGVCLENGNKIYSKTVIITTGTYLNSSILIGHEVVKSGPQGEKTTYGISEQLKELGFEIIRLKTGTPPRIKKDSVDLSQMVIQKGDDKKQTFSFNNKYNEEATSHPCYLVHTTDETKRLILENLDSSAMYGGIVEGIGPRYCPSIEDKIVRFPKNERHQIFLEPESLEIDEWYLQGLSTSLPRNVQEKLVHSIKGMENAIINKYAYAIEYDAINPMQLKFNLETKKVKNLFCAGQINGTSGYEEAAAQGIMAGINAVLLIDNKKPFVLKRNEAYIGVMIDDLITKGVDEPYRLLTSRAEHRLSIRHDNADIRLRKYGYELGLITENEYNKYLEKLEQIKKLKLEIEEINIFPTKENNNFLNEHNSASLYEKISIKNLLKRPEIKMDTIKSFLSKQYDDEVMEQVEIQTKYEGYILKDQRNIDKMLNLESKIIPKNINYNNIKHLSTEAKEKLVKVLPETIGQASRILGVNPPDISNLLIYIKQEYNK